MSKDEYNNNISRRTLSGLKWAYISTVIRSLLSLAVISLLAHLLRPEDFGLMGMALISIEIAKRFSTLGIGPAIINIKNLSPELIRVGFTSSLLMGISVCALMWLAAPWIEWFFESKSLCAVIRVISFSIILGNMEVVSRSLLTRNLAFKQIMKANIISYTAGYCLVGISFALFGLRVWSLVAAMMVTTFTRMIMLYAFSAHSMKPYFSKKEFLALIRFGGGITFVRLFNTFARQGDSLFVGKMLGVNSLGFYTRASHLTQLPVNYISENLNRVLFPAMSEIQDEKKRLKNVFGRGLELVALVSLPIAAFFAICAPEIVGAILGPQWGNTVPALQILALAIFFKMAAGLAHALTRATGAVYRGAWRVFVYMTLVLSGAWIGTRWGITGVAAGVVTAALFNYLLMLQLSLSLTGMTAEECLKCHLPSIFTCLCLCFAILPFIIFLRMMDVHVWIRLTGGAAAGGLTLLSVLLFLPNKFLGNGVDWILKKLQLDFPPPFRFITDKLNEKYAS